MYFSSPQERSSQDLLRPVLANEHLLRQFARINYQAKSWALAFQYT